jgi:RNA polymerase sigma-70 factor (ECF subfamily)
MSHTTNSLHNAEEKTLIRRSVLGDGEAFGVLYLRHLDAIYRYIFFRVGDEAVTEDLTEEVFLRAWAALPKYRLGDYPFTSWLYRIAHNLVVDHYRSGASINLSPLHANLSSNPSESPEARLTVKQEMETLAWAVQQLSDIEQQVILLRFVEGLPHREIASIIDRSEVTSRVIQHRALEALRSILPINEASHETA